MYLNGSMRETNKEGKRRPEGIEIQTSLYARKKHKGLSTGEV